MEEIDGDCYRYYLLAGQHTCMSKFEIFIFTYLKGTTHPYPDDTFYSVGRVPRKLLMKYLGVKVILLLVNARIIQFSPDVPCPAPEAASPATARAPGLEAGRGHRQGGSGRGGDHLPQPGGSQHQEHQEQLLIRQHCQCNESNNFKVSKAFHKLHINVI